MGYLDSLLHWFAMLLSELTFFAQLELATSVSLFYLGFLFSLLFFFANLYKSIDLMLQFLVYLDTKLQFFIPRAAGRVPNYHTWNTVFLQDSSFGEENAFYFIAKLDIAPQDHQKFSVIKMEPGQAISPHVVKVA